MTTTTTEPWEDTLLALLDGPYKEVRDDNHVTPNEVLVFGEAAGTVEAVDLMEIPLRYPVGTGGRWSAHDLGELVLDKALLYRQSLVAHEINDDEPAAEPTCGTVVLVVTAISGQPYRRVTVKARIDPALN
jgi:hypothetical protein